MSTLLMEAIYEREFSAEDIATFIALEYVLDRVQVKVLDIDPAMNEVEIKWREGQTWLTFEEACEYVAREIALERRDDDENASGH